MVRIDARIPRDLHEEMALVTGSNGDYPTTISMIVRRGIRLALNELVRRKGTRRK